MSSVARVNQHVTAMLASTGGFAAGITLGWSSLAGWSLRGTLNWDSAKAELVVGAVTLGASCGALLLALLGALATTPCDCRAILYHIAMPIFIAGWIVLCFAGEQMERLIVGRGLTGAGAGIFLIVIPLYIAELSSGSHRECLLYGFHAALSIGLAISYALGAAFLPCKVTPVQEESSVALDEYSAACAIACLPLFLICILPPSPLQMLLEGVESDGLVPILRTLGWVASGDERQIAREIDGLRMLVGALEQPRAKWKAFANCRSLWAFITVCCVSACYHLSGMIYVSLNLLTLLDFGATEQLTSGKLSIICGLIHVFVSLLAVWLVASLGRKNLAPLSSGLMGLCGNALGYYMLERNSDADIMYTFSWITWTWVVIYLCSFYLGIGPVYWSLLADFFPIQTRLVAASIISGLGWISYSVLNLYSSEWLLWLGIARSLWLFSSFCWFGMLLVYCLVPDGRYSLADLQLRFHIR
ncbi:hypothetical protein QAD02_022768 [Eretmocerus hayati]|uniref:Uncharacterized protein n=1 Tax=Eretmocerus hayati TaxID=131215 RepID=A0ACC2PWF6_9HYME|nr:hypothetical protein QAD02_022768 [Eretmocerus hayati]